MVPEERCAGRALNAPRKDLEIWMHQKMEVGVNRDPLAPPWVINVIIIVGDLTHRLIQAV